MQSKKKMIVNTVFLVAIFALTIYGVFHGEDLGAMMEAMRRADVRWLLPGLLCVVLMPLAAPIGTNKGLRMKDFLQIIIEQATVPVVVDAGIGAPSHAAEAMEMGASACLVNTAIAVAGDPVEMAKAFKEAVVCGRRAYEAGLGAISDCAEASSPLTAFLND